MRRTSKFALSAATIALTTTAMIGVVSAKSLSTPTITAKPGAMLHIPHTTTTTTSLALNENPRALTAGSPTTLAVTVPPSTSSVSYSSGEFVKIADAQSEQVVWQYPPKSNSSYLFTPSNQQPGKDVTFPSSNDNVWSASNQRGYYSMSDILDLNGLADQTQNIKDISGKIVATTNTTVKWIKPFLTLTANPTNPVIGQQVTLTATYQGGNNDVIYIRDLSGNYTLDGSNVDSGRHGVNPETITAMDNTAQTVLYQANLIDLTTGHTVKVRSNLVKVKWVSPSGAL